eukprot:CAMPEP_0115755218 /NCGR_PEP_ID=MMETSP0272-20121206/97280_1 /TAXON_ID=71861 /ORGANISM="Scrippsiella trochoidea, Strain CCMP3099" /LENGTH=142 /DNA_ID=CAMNT_0003200665 /DNA_START=200 /DNA_END=624 /DNA_ORIENTATION=+
MRPMSWDAVAASVKGVNIQGEAFPAQSNGWQILQVTPAIPLWHWHNRRGAMPVAAQNHQQHNCCCHYEYDKHDTTDAPHGELTPALSLRRTATARAANICGATMLLLVCSTNGRDRRCCCGGVGGVGSSIGLSSRSYHIIPA